MIDIDSLKGTKTANKMKKPDHYTSKAKPTPKSMKGKINVKNEPKTKKPSRADLLKKIESLKEHNAKQLVANRNEVFKGRLYKDDLKLLAGEMIDVKEAIKTAEILVEFKDEQIDILSSENVDLFRTKSKWVFGFFISSIALIGTNIGWYYYG